MAALTLPQNMLQTKNHGIAFLKGQEIHFKQPNISLLYYFGKPSKNTLVSLFIDRLTNYRFRYFQAPVFSHFSPKLFLRFQLKMLTAHISILKFTSSFFPPSQLQFLHLDSHYLKCNILLSILKHDSEISSKSYYSIAFL